MIIEHPDPFTLSASESSVRSEKGRRQASQAQGSSQSREWPPPPSYDFPKPDAMKTLPALPSTSTSTEPNEPSSPHSPSSSQTESYHTVNNAVTIPGGSPINGVVLSMRREDIFGTWNIDPSLPRLPAPKHPSLFERKKKEAPLNVSLNSRRGAIMVRLSVVGSSPLATKIHAATNKGAIHLDIFSKNPGQRINVDTKCRRGNTVVLLPRNFSGVVDLRTRRKTDIDVLPSLSASAHILRTSRDGTVVVIGSMAGVPAKATDATTTAMLHGDYGVFSCRKGRLRIGFSGEDVSQQPAPGFWSRLGTMILRR